MKTNKISRVFSALMVIAFLAACSGGSSESGQSGDAAAASNEAPAGDKVMEIFIEGNDLMQFNTKEITVFAGYKIKLTLKHTGQLPKISMGHNWVLLNEGTSVADFGTKAAAASETGYIPADAGDQVIANTKLLGGGEEDTIEFMAPPVGEYDYLCTFPGHWGAMNGKMIVAEAE